MEILANALTTARLAEIVAAEVQFDDSITLTVEIDKEKFLLNTRDLRVVSGDVRKLQTRAPNLRGRFNRIKDAHTMTVDELRARGLPLYWNEKWLRNELEKLGTYAAVAREHGFPNPTTIASYAKRNFKLDVQGEYDRKRNEAIRVYRESLSTDHPISHTQLAERYDVATATIYRWLKEDKQGFVYDPERTNRRRPTRTASMNPHEVTPATPEPQDKNEESLAPNDIDDIVTR
jgi:transposase-like protein